MAGPWTGGANEAFPPESPETSHFDTGASREDAIPARSPGSVGSSTGGVYLEVLHFRSRKERHAMTLEDPEAPDRLQSGFPSDPLSRRVDAGCRDRTGRLSRVGTTTSVARQRRDLCFELPQYSSARGEREQDPEEEIHHADDGIGRGAAASLSGSPLNGGRHSCHAQPRVCVHATTASEAINRNRKNQSRRTTPCRKRPKGNHGGGQRGAGRPD